MNQDYPSITFEAFQSIQMCAGTILDAQINEKARMPAYILTIDFGSWGIKTSSAQITEHYTPSSLIGRQIIAVMNFPAKKVAGVKSEVLVLACVSDEQGTILLHPSHPVPNGSLVA